MTNELAVRLLQERRYDGNIDVLNYTQYLSPVTLLPTSSPVRAPISLSNS